ncbi:MAG: hypothetical protein JNK48_00530 [Bryobacterales bacterium]|nr:hypothetical protein [Bryobacterales bacterium]
MENISPDELAIELLNQCLRGNAHSSELLGMLLRYALSADASQARRASHALFGIVVERLGDLFEPCLVDCYASLFSETIAYALPDFEAEELLERYRRVRMPRRFAGPAPRKVFVLSRVTLGADVAVTSVAMNAAKQRFPEAEIVFVGPAKNYELFAADGRIRHLATPYRREGLLRERLSVFPALSSALSEAGSIVIDPDSRLTQLGLLPVCEEENYYFFESRSYGEYGDETIGALAGAWCMETFGLAEKPAAYLCPQGDAGNAEATVSFGVGENPAKRLGGSFERDALGVLAGKAGTVLADRGGSEEEGARVDRAAAGYPNVATWTGAFAAFAASISRSEFYLGYDSAGQHVAAASAVPMVVIFCGHASPRFLARWRPESRAAAHVIAVEQDSREAAAQRAMKALESVCPGPRMR